MAKRDPNKTTRNRRVKDLKEWRRKHVGGVLKITGYESESSLNAVIGHRFQEYCDVKHRQYTSFEAIFNQYMTSLRLDALSRNPPDRFEMSAYILCKRYQSHTELQKYVDNAIESTFLKNFDHYSRPKPHPEKILWLGQNNADFGLLITPRFNEVLEVWENDQSEVRKAKFVYYTIGHVLSSGLCVPDKDQRIDFETAEKYLEFFRSVLVRGTASVHQLNVADRYVDFVSNHDSPEGIPLLLPELRYLGKEKKHKHRLDFAIVDSHDFNTVGIELSPWSSHGKLTGTKNKKQSQINDDAKENFEKEFRKLRNYFLNQKIPVITFTDENLEDPDSVFEMISLYLEPRERQEQLLLLAKDTLLDTDFDSEESPS